MTKIEEVARALYYDDNTSERPDWEREPPSVQARYRRSARVAIEAMRQITPAMERANGRHNARQAAQWDNIISAALRDTG